MKKFGIILITVVLMLLCGCNRIAVNSAINDLENSVEQLEKLTEKILTGKVPEREIENEYFEITVDFEEALGKLDLLNDKLSNKDWEKLTTILSRVEKLGFYNYQPSDFEYYDYYF